MTFIDEKGKEVNWLCVLYDSLNNLLDYLKSKGITAKVVVWEHYRSGGRRVLQIAGADAEKLSRAIFDMSHIANTEYLATHDEHGHPIKPYTAGRGTQKIGLGF